MRQLECREMFHGLNIHVLVKREFWQLGPERDIHGEGELQGIIYIVMGHDAHGCRRQFSAKSNPSVHIKSLPFGVLIVNLHFSPQNKLT
jgi:hypothetical protein